MDIVNQGTKGTKGYKSVLYPLWQNNGIRVQRGTSTFRYCTLVPFPVAAGV